MRWHRMLARTLRFLGDVTGLKGDPADVWWSFYTIIKDRDEDEDYLERYYLFSTRWLKPFIPSWSYRVVLHRTLRSDIDGLHDHPWSWKSRILEGGYQEDTPGGPFWRAPEHGWRSRTGEDYHRLVLVPDRLKPDEQVWSLFVMGPRYKDWGFLDKEGKWVHHQEYFKNREKYFSETE